LRAQLAERKRIERLRAIHAGITSPPKDSSLYDQQHHQMRPQSSPTKQHDNTMHRAYSRPVSASSYHQKQVPQKRSIPAYQALPLSLDALRSTPSPQFISSTTASVVEQQHQSSAATTTATVVTLRSQHAAATADSPIAAPDSTHATTQRVDVSSLES
jgi:hypothetical protein